MRFENPSEIIMADSYDSMRSALNRVDELKNSKYIVGYIKYDAWKIFSCGDKSEHAKSPLAYFEVFEDFSPYVAPKNSEKINAYLLPHIDKPNYRNKIGDIKNLLADGITYEVNFTYQSDVITDLVSDRQIFEALSATQPTPYSAFIQNSYTTIISLSPELFFEIEGKKITTRPMKGTIKRGATQTQDELNSRFLFSDEKNRAENLMIVDLMRNDLSSISKAGSVKVSKMFNVEKLPSLYQMTSEISSELKDGISSFEIFSHLFPCGSITGAPKISTMLAIERLESEPRGVYCGAICLFSPKKTLCSVAIRTLQKDAGESRFKFGAGGAIVWDSDSDSEWAETVAKSDFITGDFKILETVLVENRVPRLWDLHVARMLKSAKALGFSFDKKSIRSISPEHDGMMRVLLSRNGAIEIGYRDLTPNKSRYFVFSETPTYSKNFLLYHKTTRREWYSNASKLIESGKVYDVIFVNERGEITEGSRTNILIEKNGVLYTPPVRCGLLNGIMRQYRSADIVEKILYKDDILSADKVIAMNSVRGSVELHYLDTCICK